MSTFTFSEENLNKLKRMKNHYPPGCERSAVMGALWLAQEQQGYVSDASMREISSLLSIPFPQVYELATYYKGYRLTPVGKYHIEFCKGICCSLRQKEEVRKACLAYLKIDAGEMTADGLFSISEVECLGGCVSAPVMRLNGQYYDKLTPEGAVEILKKVRSHA